MKALLSTLAAIIAFTVVCGVSAGLAWVGGYNFDTRGHDIAVWCLMTLVFSSAFAVMVYAEIEGRE